MYYIFKHIKRTYRANDDMKWLLVSYTKRSCGNSRIGKCVAGDFNHFKMLGMLLQSCKYKIYFIYTLRRTINLYLHVQRTAHGSDVMNVILRFFQHLFTIHTHALHFRTISGTQSEKCRFCGGIGVSTARYIARIYT